MDNLDKALTDLFGHAQFRPRQREAVEAVLAGRSVVAVFATGGGKSLCYQLAGSLLPGVTLVFSPLVSLMKDQSETRLAHRLKLTTINSHTPPDEAAERLKGLADGTYRMLLVAPERLRRPDFVEAVRRVQVSLLVVDEAHCISEWGHDFRPDYRLIRGFREWLGKPPVMALTATATPQVRKDIKTQLGVPDAVEVVGSADRPNIAISVQRLRSERVKLEEVGLALRATLGMGLRPGGERDPESGSVIVYVPTTRAAERLAEDLTQQLRLKVLPYHAKLPPAMRTRVQEAFMGGQAPVVVATNAFGMGLDKPDVRLVMHYGVPASLEAYYQEIGRAGRDGRPARALLLYTAKDVDFRRWLLDEGRVRPDDVRKVLDALMAGQSPDLAPPRRAQAEAPARPQKLLTGRRGVRPPARTIELPLPQEEAAATKLQAILTELEMQGVIDRRAKGPASIRVGVNMEEGLDKAVLTAGTLLDRLYRQRLVKFRKVEEFLATAGCRRDFILRYFGEKLGKKPRPCCDRCARTTDSALVGGLPQSTRRVRISRPPGDTEKARARAAQGADEAARSGRMSVEAVLQAGKHRDVSAVPALLGLLEADREETVLAASTALGRIKDDRAEAPLRRLLTDPRPQVQRHAAQALGELGRTLETVLALELMAAGQEGTPSGRAASLALARVKRRAKPHTPAGKAVRDAAGDASADQPLDAAESGVLAVLAGALGTVTEEDVALHVSGRRAHPSLAPEAFGLLRATPTAAVRRTFARLREQGLLRGGEVRGRSASLTQRGRAALVSHRG